MLYLVTATGMRPEAWEICEDLMAAQHYDGPVTWIVVDDGEEAQPIRFSRDGWELQFIRPEPFWQPGQNTQGRNLLAGLNSVPDDARVVIIEDDDWYAPDWLAHVNRELDKAELVGEFPARYYNVATRKGRELRNYNHSSLCSCALRGQAIERLRELCRQRHNFIDLQLWKKHRSRHLFRGGRVVGIKGLPGREGIGMGHRSGFVGQKDPQGVLLRTWIGDDAEFYL